MICEHFLGPLVKSMKLLIRVAEAADVAELVALENATFAGDRLSRRSFRRLLAVPSAMLWVARAEAVVAGYALVFFRRGSRVGRLYSIAVAKRCRGRGVAHQLMAVAEEAVRVRHCDRLRLEVRVDNAAAIQLYQQLGYVASGRLANYYEDGCDALRLQKRLLAPV